MRFRRAAGAAVVVLSLSTSTPVGASNHCIAVSGTVTVPGWVMRLTPGLSLEPRMQQIWAYSWLPTSHLVLTCTGVRTVTITGFPEFTWATLTGSSFIPEDLASGAGQAGGGWQYTFAVTATAGIDAGGWTTTGEAWSDLSLSYVRGPAAAALVLTLEGLVVDRDGFGPLPPEDWGDVAITAASPVEAYPEEPGWGSSVYTWPAPGVAATA